VKLDHPAQQSKRISAAAKAGHRRNSQVIPARAELQLRYSHGRLLRGWSTRECMGHDSNAAQAGDLTVDVIMTFLLASTVFESIFVCYNSLRTKH